MLGGVPDSDQISESAAAFGFSGEIEVDDPSVYVWPENWTAVVVFSRMATQWTVGMRGAVGLRYESLETVLRLLSVPDGDREDVFERVRIMESEALKFYAECRERG